MHLPKFEHLRPSSLEEASRLLREHRPRAGLAAGGTDFYPRMKYGLTHPEVVVSLKGIPIKPLITGRNGELRLYPLMTLADIVRSPLVRENAPLLAEAVR